MQLPSGSAAPGIRIELRRGATSICVRRSNYELAKIGTNLNQVARAFNLLVKSGSGGTLPEIGKKMAALRSEIKKHTSKVLGVLESRTVVWEKRAADWKLGKKGPG